MDGEADCLLERRHGDLTEWETVLGRFREQCRSANVPTFADIAGLLASFPSGERVDMLVNLVCEHLERSWERGPGWRIEDYVRHFGPEFVEFRSPGAVPVDVVECEFLARHTTPGTADHPEIEEYRQRFAERSDVAQRLERHCLGAQRYVLIRRQGQGGLGRVWVAYDCHLQRYVAIKEPNPAVADNVRIVERLAREARLTAVLDHPGIVSVHELHETHGALPFYVMRLVEGRTLREHIRDYHQAQAAGSHKSLRVEYRQLLQSYLGVCEAVAYAHQQSALHRDLKTDNVVLGPFGETVVLDWGLAKRQPQGETLNECPEEPSKEPLLPPAGETPADRNGETLDTSVAGTPQYMACEQALGRAEQRSDIFGLGAILYEILTGRAPYASTTEQDTLELMNRVRAAEFPRPRDVAAHVPRPLEAICLKAMAARLDDRYATATAVADDVRHFLADEPVSVYPNRLHHRAARFIRRHAPTSIATGILAMLVLSVIAYAFYAVARHSRRQTAVERLQRIQLTMHRDGWSKDAWGEVEKAAQIDRDANLRDQAFATLSGVDARIWRHFDFAATTVAFDADGKRLLFGGYDESGAHLWDRTNDVVQVSAQPGSGPVVFATDGSAWQVLAASSCRYVIRDVAQNVVVRTLEIPVADADLPEREQMLPAMATTARGELFAASPILPDGTLTVAVWNTADGQLLRSFPVKANALAFSPDAQWLAAGDEQGRVVIWSLATGEAAARLSSEEVSVQSLAFGRDPRTAGDDTLERGLLAVGDAGGTITIWDLGRKIPRSYCRGTARQIYDIAFSPDGVTLASCGRIRVRLWDVASGRPLLEIAAGNTNYGLAFSPDGTQLVVTGAPVFGEPARADIYDLEFGRGVQTLRGLYTSIGRVKFSRDGRQLAAFSNDWRVGIWDCAAGQLKLVLKVPEGFFDDNADMDISQDGQQLAFAAGSRATLWNVATGQLERTWELPPGLQDQIRFCPDGKLLLVRFETKDGTLPPANVAPSDKHPRVCRVRDLLAADPARPLVEITEFNQHVFWIVATADGSAFAVIGIHRGPEGQRQSLRVFDGLSGKAFWGIPVPKANIWAPSDPMGELLLVNCDSGSGDLVKFRTGTLLRRIPALGHLSPQARYVGSSLGIWNGETGEELVRLDANLAACKYSSFSPDGKCFAWGTLDGSVFVCDIPEVLRRLSTVGLIGH